MSEESAKDNDSESEDWWQFGGKWDGDMDGLFRTKWGTEPLQISACPPNLYAVFISRDLEDKELYYERVVCWALVNEKWVRENGEVIHEQKTVLGMFISVDTGFSELGILYNNGFNDTNTFLGYEFENEDRDWKKIAEERRKRLQVLRNRGILVV